MRSSLGSCIDGCSLEAVIPGVVLNHVGSSMYDFRPTHESIQQRKIKLATGPMRGMYPRAKETTTEVKTMTTRYADVAIAVSSPVYVTDCCCTAPARFACCREYVRFAITEHHELCRVYNIRMYPRNNSCLLAGARLTLK